MTVTLSVAIMHCDWVDERRAFVFDIVRSLARQGIKASVVKDTNRRLWDTARRAWLAVDRGATHHLVLQDDVLLCERFVERCTAAIDAAPGNPMAFFTFNRGAVAKARAQNSSWYADDSPGSGLATCLPASLVYDFLRWEKAHVAWQFKHDDGRLRMWGMATGRKFLVSTASLVQHLGEKSVQGNRPPIDRSAPWFLMGNEPIDWSRGADGSVVHSRPDVWRMKEWEMCNVKPKGLRP